MPSKLGAILFVANERDEPPAVGVVDNLCVEAVRSEVLRVPRHAQELGVSAECDWRIEPSPGVLRVQLHDYRVVWVNPDDFFGRTPASVTERNVDVLEPWILLIVHFHVPDEALRLMVDAVGIVEVKLVGVAP